MKKSLVIKPLVGLTVVSILIVASVVVLSKNKVYKMVGPSMIPTIQPGEKVKARAVPADEVKRGDIIVLTSPVGENMRIVKRVVGLPGDTVEVLSGELIVTKSDGSTYKPYNDNSTSGSSKALVKPDFFYVVGDNRLNSLDSRIAEFGQIPFESLQSVVKE